jgi:hypothetical protein
LIGLRLPKGECDVQALYEVIDRWVAPTLAALYIEQHFTANQGVSRTARPDGSAVPNV